MRTLWEWFLDVICGPRCGMCGYRARGPRSLISHMWIDHAGDAS